MKKLLSIVLAGTLAASMVAVGATAVGAEETGLVLINTDSHHHFVEDAEGSL